jgi:hypothetical protein
MALPLRNMRMGKATSHRRTPPMNFHFLISILSLVPNHPVSLIRTKMNPPSSYPPQTRFRRASPPDREQEEEEKDEEVEEWDQRLIWDPIRAAAVRRRHEALTMKHRRLLCQRLQQQQQPLQLRQEDVSWGHFHSASLFASLLDFVPVETLRALLPVAPHVAFFVHRQWRIHCRDESYFPLLHPSWRAIDASAPWIRLVLLAPREVHWESSFLYDRDCANALSAYADHLQGISTSVDPTTIPFLCRKICRMGMLGFLVWAHERKCPLDDFAYNDATLAGHLHIVQWLHSIRHPWNRSVYADAAFDKFFHIFQWLTSKGYPLNSQICEVASCRSEPRVLHFIHAGSYDTWPCFGDICDWARKHCADALPQ